MTNDTQAGTTVWIDGDTKAKLLELARMEQRKIVDEIRLLVNREFRRLMMEDGAHSPTE